MHAAEGPQRVDRAVSSPLSIISLGDVGGDGGVTDRATRGTCSAGSGIVRCTTSLGLRSPYDSIPSPSRVCVESNHSGMGWPIIHSKSVHLTPAPARQSGGNVAYPQIMTGGLRRGPGGGGGGEGGELGSGRSARPRPGSPSSADRRDRTQPFPRTGELFIPCARPGVGSPQEVVRGGSVVALTRARDTASLVMRSGI